MPDRTGMFYDMYRAVQPRLVTEFVYRHSPNHDDALVYMAMEWEGPQEEGIKVENFSDEVIGALAPLGVQTMDISGDEMAKTHSRYLAEPLSLAHATALWDAFRAIHNDTYGCVPQWADLMFDAFGGAIADVAPAGTAFPYRGALAQLQYNVFWDGPTAPKGCVEWLDGLYTASSDFLPDASYVNYPSAELVNYGTSYFGANYVRLQKLKAAIDPAGAFAYPQSIQPAGS